MWSRTLFFLTVCFLFCSISVRQTLSAPPGDVTLDFETGSLLGWQKTGTAFDFQPTLGDNPTARHRGQPSRHQGSYWIGTYEKYQGRAGQRPGGIQGDRPVGTLTSRPFTISDDKLSFLVGGGSSRKTCVELLVHDPIEQTYVPVKWASGRNTETMSRVVWDISSLKGRSARLRIVDGSSGPWGHINADDFRFYGQQPVPTPQPRPAVIPGALRVKKGQPAVFRSSLQDTSVPQTWSGPGGQSGRGPVFTVDTTSISPGTYTIYLRVQQRQGHNILTNLLTAMVPVEARATLTVVSAEPRYSIRLRARPNPVYVSQEVEFSALLRPPASNALYSFSFGDGINTGWISSSITRHRYQRPGVYDAEAYARPGSDQMPRSRVVRITVLSPNWQLRLQADKNSIKTGETVRFSGSLTPADQSAQYVFFWGDGLQSSLLAKPQAAHEYRSHGNFQVFCVAYVGNRRVRSNTIQVSVQERNYEMGLSVVPEPAYTGEKVFFNAVVTPHDPEMRYRFTFGDNTGRVEGSSPEAEHVYSRPGTYYAKAEALLSGKTVAESRPKRVLVKIHQPPPEASISPKNVTVQQGGTARFKGTALPESAKGLHMLWSGPGVKERPGNYLEVDTSSLEPGSYRVSLKVTDKFGRSAVAAAGLKVVPLRVKVDLTVKPASIQEGQEAGFEVRTTPELPGAEFRYHFGQDMTSGWLHSSSARHRYDEPGTYYCFEEVRKGGRIVGTSEKTVLTVRPKPEPEKLEVRLSSDTRSSFPGKRITFTAETLPSRNDVVFQFDFGDGKGKTPWKKEARAAHSYFSPGIYRVKALVKTPRGNIFESGQLEVRVEEAVPPGPRWPEWEFWAAALLFGISYAIFKITRKKGKKESRYHSGSGSEVRIRLNKDEGVQEISCEKPLSDGPEIRIRPVKDQGSQEIIEE